MERIKSFNDFKKINEAGWNSIDEDAGDIVVNGVSLDLTAIYNYDTPDMISYEVCVKPSNEDLIKIGIWSDSYAEEDEDSRWIFIFMKEKELTKKELKSMGAETVRDIEDENIFDYFSKDWNKVPSEFTAQEFIDLAKSIDFNTEANGLDDLHLLDSEAAPGYRLLGRLGAFKKP